MSRPPYWSCAPGARTIRMCSFDARSGGPNQAATLEMENEQAWKDYW